MKLRALAVALSLLIPAVAAGGDKKERGRRGGALSQVVGSIRSKPANRPPKRESRPVERSADSNEVDDHDRHYEPSDDLGDDLVADATGALFGAVYLGVRPPGGQTDLDLRAGFQTVQHSDFSLNGSMRASVRGFTLELGAHSFVESVSPDETLTMLMWRGTGGYRIVRRGLGEVTADVGLTGLTTPGLDLLGALMGMSGRLALGNAVGLDGALRAYIYNDGTNAIEAEAGVRLSVLRAGYRITRFDVGPPLRGPQLGLAFSF